MQIPVREVVVRRTGNSFSSVLFLIVLQEHTGHISKRKTGGMIRIEIYLPIVIHIGIMILLLVNISEQFTWRYTQEKTGEKCCRK